MTRWFEGMDRRSALALVIATAVGFYMIGYPSGILAALAVGIYLIIPQSAAPAAAFAALALLGTAMVATLMEAPLGAENLGLDFADERPIAGTAAAAAGALAAVSVLLGAFIEREPRRAFPPRGERRMPTPGQLRSIASRHLPLIGSLTLAALVRLVLAPTALPALHRQVADNMFAGEAAGSGLGNVVIAPLGPALVTVVPVGGTFLLLLAGLGTVAVAVRLGERLGDRRGAWMAGIVAATLPSLWAQQLPAALATLAVGLAFLVLLGDQITRRRIATVGLLVGLATWSDPSALVAIAVFAVWIAGTLPKSERGGLATFLVTSLLCVAVVARWTIGEADGIPRLPGDIGEPGYPLGIVGLALDIAAYALVVWGITSQRERRARLPLLVLPPAMAATALLTSTGGGLWGPSAVLVASGAGAALARLGMVSARERITEARSEQ